MATVPAHSARLAQADALRDQGRDLRAKAQYTLAQAKFEEALALVEAELGAAHPKVPTV